MEAAVTEVNLSKNCLIAVPETLQQLIPTLFSIDMSMNKVFICYTDNVYDKICRGIYGVRHARDHLNMKVTRVYRF